VSAGPHRRYTTREKVTTVMAAEMTSLTAAAEAAHIPKSTVQSWLDNPKIAQLRTTTREQLADEARVLQQLAAQAIRARLPEFEPRDLTILYGVVADKAQLLSGAATTRTEHRDLTEKLSDHEKDALADAIDAFLKDTVHVDG
jgi:hypothetical protein